MEGPNKVKKRWKALFKRAVKERAFFAAAYLVIYRRQVEATLSADASEEAATSCEAMFKYTLH